MILLLILLTSIPSAKPILQWNGVSVRPRDPKWLFTVQIHYNETYICTGSAITDYFVLTAAHCLTESLLETWKITVVADPDFWKNSLQDTFPDYKHVALWISIHEGYVPIEYGGNYRDDLGLIKVMKRLPYKMDLHHAWLSLELGSICEYAGWGGENVAHVARLSKTNTSVYHIVDSKIYTLDFIGQSVAEKVTKAVVIPMQKSRLCLFMKHL